MITHRPAFEPVYRGKLPGGNCLVQEYRNGKRVGKQSEYNRQLILDTDEDLMEPLHLHSGGATGRMTFYDN